MRGQVQDSFSFVATSSGPSGHLYYAPYYGVNLDGSCNAIYGTTPDYEPNAAAALTDCLALIRQGG